MVPSVCICVAKRVGFPSTLLLDPNRLISSTHARRHSWWPSSSDRLCAAALSVSAKCEWISASTAMLQSTNEPV